MRSCAGECDVAHFPSETAPHEKTCRHGEEICGDKTKDTPPDWERIELDYRAGIKSLRQIGEEHCISHPGIAKRAKASGWERDLAAKIQAKNGTLVTKSVVTKEVTTKNTVSEREVIETNKWILRVPLL